MKFRFLKKNIKETGAAVFIILAGNILGAYLLFTEQEEVQTVYLERNSFGEGAYEETLQVRTGDKERKIRILVEEQQYTAEEIRQYLSDAKKELDFWIAKAGDKSGKLVGDLEFPNAIPDNPVQLFWSTDRPEILDWEGRTGELKETGEEVRLMCSVSLGEEMEMWEKSIQIYPDKIGKEEKLQEDIRKETERINSDFSKKLYLPESLHGEKLIYEKEKTNSGFIICLCSVILGLGIFPLKKEKEKQQKEKKMKEMQLDYPDIVEKLVLFLRAGFSIQKSMEKLASNYIRNKEKYHMKERYAYEEIVRTCKEMEGGVYEAEAYERMGRRCMLPEYKVFSVLLIQNLQKGNQSILELLEREAASAGDERRRRAKIRGDEASTKLLLPMVLQLIVVVTILIVPAFLSFI